MLDRLQYVKQRFDEISDLIIQPDVIADQKRYVQLNKEYKDLKGLVEKREEYIALDGNIKEANEIINTIKICDPAVGSGHFLVSALNEISNSPVLFDLI